MSVEFRIEDTDSFAIDEVYEILGRQVGINHVEGSVVHSCHGNPLTGEEIKELCGRVITFGSAKYGEEAFFLFPGIPRKDKRCEFSLFRQNFESFQMKRHRSPDGFHRLGLPIKAIAVKGAAVKSVLPICEANNG